MHCHRDQLQPPASPPATTLIAGISVRALPLYRDFHSPLLTGSPCPRPQHMYERTPPHAATSVEVAQLPFYHGADVTAQDKLRRSPWHDTSISCRVFLDSFSTTAQTRQPKTYTSRLSHR